MQIGITFEHPWALAFFPVSVVFIVLTGRRRHQSLRFRYRFAQVLRYLLILLLTLAAASPGIYTKAGMTATVFIADVSDSMKQTITDMEDFILKATGHAGTRDKIGVVSFADEASVLKMPEDENHFNVSLQGRIQSVGTDMEKGMSFARSITPENAAKRLVLITDGRQTKGDAVGTARLLKRLGYTLDVVPYESDAKTEVQMEEFIAPKQVNVKERFDVSVKIFSNADTKATIRLFGNRTLTAEKEVDLYSGENLFTFSDEVDQGGMVTYTAEVVTDDDTVFQNNQLSALTEIADRPSLLIVESGNGGENLVSYIESYAQITRMQPEEVPTTLQGILGYDAYILVDISAEWLDNEFLNHLEQAVKYQGKGLLTIGGENSYAPGGYNDTPLETILPVHMDIRPKEENPDLGLVLVIDKSGSMTSGEYGVSKLELAKEAAIRAAEVLEENDQLGVIAFDDAIQWVVQTAPLTNRNETMDLIGTIRPGGGTQILHPLEEAWQNLREKDAKLKHIILLTDGQAEQYGYERMIEGVRQDGITLSTVAVGRGADTLLLKALAYGGMGRYYQTDEFSDIPSIFAKEAFLAGQKYLQNRRFYPELVASRGLLKGLDAVPMLDGYVATRAKDTASTVFRSDIQEPVLAVWQYGLGRTAAWTSDIRGIWTSQWSLWQDAPVFWGNLVGWLVQKNLSAGYAIQTELRDGRGVITVESEPGKISYEESLSGTMVSPNGSKDTIRFDAIKPGVYESAVNADEPGAYIIHLEIPGDEGIENVSSGIVMPYSQEYRVLNTNAEGFLQKLAMAGGGRVIKEPEEVFTGEVQDMGVIRDITRPLLWIGLLLLLADIAYRKLQISVGPVLLFWNEKLVPAVAGFIQSLKQKRPIGAGNSKRAKEEGRIREPDKTKNMQEESNEKRREHKEKTREPAGNNDHVNALLNRRKKWK